MRADLPENEEDRIVELHRFDILDTLPEQAYDDITYLAAQICQSPIALVSFVDRERQWFKSKVGYDEQESSRDIAFCAHAIIEPTQLLVVPDATADARFRDNPLVTHDPSIRFYAGAPLVTSTGNALGTLCVIDRVPRELTPDQEHALRALARQVMAQLELRRMVGELQVHAEARSHYAQQLEEYQRELEASLARSDAVGRTDALTGVLNRWAVLQRLEEELDRFRRYASPLSIALVDIDDFKAHNDSGGHPAGDELLIHVAKVLNEHSRATDVLARYGGDEFVVILCNTASEGAYVIAERFRKAVDRSDWSGHRVTVSIGVATADTERTEASELIAAADRALYRVKESGRNRVAVEGPVGDFESSG